MVEHTFTNGWDWRKDDPTEVQAPEPTSSASAVPGDGANAEAAQQDTSKQAASPVLPDDHVAAEKEGVLEHLAHEIGDLAEKLDHALQPAPVDPGHTGG